MKRSIVMGKYPQNRGLKNEPIEWIVLQEKQGCCLCLSKYLLDCRPYHNCSAQVTWQDCTLRKWLNHDFFMTAFSAEEREKILLSHVANPAQNTQDHIFLLNYDEVEAYMDYEERGAVTTAYARERGAWFLEEDCDEKNSGLWFLRHYGEAYEAREGNYHFISCVNFDGYIEQAATDVSAVNCCVRPAFWLKIG